MKTKNFEKKIKHLSQTQILTGAVSSLNRALVSKGIATEAELQSYFQAWLRNYMPPHKTSKGRKKIKK